MKIKISSSRVELLRSSGAWYVTKIAREDRYAGSGGDEKILIELPDAARDAVIRHALADYRHAPISQETA